MMPERACEAYGTGVYGRQTYLERVQKVDAARAGLQARAEELEAGIEESGERHEKAESGAAIEPTLRISLEI